MLVGFCQCHEDVILRVFVGACFLIWWEPWISRFRKTTVPAVILIQKSCRASGMTFWIGQELRGGFQLKILVSWLNFCRFDFISDMSSDCFPWAILAQCYGQLVKQMVEYHGREARTVLRIHSERNFGSKLRANQDLARFQRTERILLSDR